MSELLKFENIKESDILVSPWGSEEVAMVMDIRPFDVWVSLYGVYLSSRLTKAEFETIFGGWRVKGDV